MGPLTDPFLTHPQGDFWYQSKLLLSLRRRRVWVDLGVLRPAEGEADVLENLLSRHDMKVGSINLSLNGCLLQTTIPMKMVIFYSYVSLPEGSDLHLHSAGRTRHKLSSMRGSAISCHPTSQPRTKPGTLRHRSEDTAIGYQFHYRLYMSVPIDPADFSKICCQRSS